MDSSDLSLDNSVSSDEEVHFDIVQEKTMSLRERPKKRYVYF